MYLRPTEACLTLLSGQEMATCNNYDMFELVVISLEKCSSALGVTPRRSKGAGKAEDPWTSTEQAVTMFRSGLFSDTVHRIIES